MKRLVGFFSFFALIIFCFASFSIAANISYSLQDLGSNRWEYFYSVENGGLTNPIEEVTIYFDYGLYENLTAASFDDWDVIVADPNDVLGWPQSGIYDALSLSSGIPVGTTEGGFRVAFDWLGSGTPGAQAFDIVDPISFETLESGITTAASVPEPSTLLLLLFGCSGLLPFRRYPFSK